MLVPLPEIIRYVLPKFLQYLILWITFAGFFLLLQIFCVVFWVQMALYTIENRHIS